MLSIIGGGRMGASLVHGLLAVDRATPITVIERSPERRRVLQTLFPSVVVAEVPVAGPGAVIAVNPKDVELAVGDAVAAGNQRILSIAAGIPLARLHEWAGAGTAVLRAMPNVGAEVGRAATALCAGLGSHAEDIAWAREVLSAVGSVVSVDEEHMDAVTGLSGSGPAYVFLMAESLIDAGVTAGLSHDVARQLTVATLQGAAALLEGDRSPHDLRAQVTTPAGTTSAALHVLENHGVRVAFIDAVLAAAHRSAEIGRTQSGHG